MEGLAENGATITAPDEPSGAPGLKRAARARRVRARIDRVSLALPMALLLGGALAFALFAAPVRWPGAHAPPGEAVRLLIAIVGGCLAALPVWALFRRLERPLRPGRIRAAPATVADAGAPTLRRADAHPDAPPRRPIFAAADLGAPLDAIEPTWTPSAVWGGTAEPAAPPSRDMGEEEAAGTMPSEASPRATEVLAEAEGMPPPATMPPATVPPATVPTATVPPVAMPAHAVPAVLTVPAAASSRDADAASAASLLARLEAALVDRSAEPVPPGATSAVRRGALDELRKIGKQR